MAIFGLWTPNMEPSFPDILGVSALLTMVPLKKNPQRTEGSTNMDFHPRNRSWAVPKHKHSHPNFDWTKANSFQVKTSVTDGNEVIPKIIANPKETTPIRIRKQIYIPNFKISWNKNIFLGMYYLLWKNIALAIFPPNPCIYALNYQLTCRPKFENNRNLDSKFGV